MLERGATSADSRFSGRRNARSAGPLFERILAGHRALHDLQKPLVKADHDHALDTWQWVLELDPDAGLALQAAALYHDIEHLDSEAEVRVEHRAPDDQAFNDEHARRGALVAARSLAAAGLPSTETAHVIDLVSGHERPFARGEATLLADADVLSFFSCNLEGFLRCYGPSHTRLKIAWSLRRLRPGARRMIERIRWDRAGALLVAAALGELR